MEAVRLNKTSTAEDVQRVCVCVCVLAVYNKAQPFYILSLSEMVFYKNLKTVYDVDVLTVGTQTFGFRAAIECHIRHPSERLVKSVFNRQVPPGKVVY